MNSNKQMSSLLWTAVLVGAAAALVACAVGFHAPDDVQGDIAVVIVNDTGQGVCDFRMIPRGESGQGENWTGIFIFDPGKSRTVKLKRGMYRVIAVGCDDSFSGSMALNVAQPVELHIGPTGSGSATQAGYTYASLPVRETPGAAGEESEGDGGGGGECHEWGMPCGEDFGLCCEGTCRTEPAPGAGKHATQQRCGA